MKHLPVLLMVNHDITGARGNVKWIPKAEMGMDAVIQPDESRTLICEHNNWKMSTIPEYDIRVLCSGGTLHIMSIYSIPLPFSFQESN